MRENFNNAHKTVQKSPGTDIPQIQLSLYFMICVKTLAWYYGRMYNCLLNLVPRDERPWERGCCLLFSYGRQNGSFSILLARACRMSRNCGVIISGHKVDSESDTFDVSKHGKHFYLLEHDHKVNYVSSARRVGLLYKKDGSACRTF